MKEQIRNYIQRYIEVSDTEFDFFFDKLKVQQLSKKETLLERGRICKHQFFIIEGLVCSQQINEKGNERILHFGIENWWFTDMESFINKTPSELSIIALEKTTIVSIHKNDLEEVYKRFPVFERFFRLITEKTLIALHRKNEYYLKMNSRERYNHLVKEIPYFVQRVPQYMIASYLEITPEYHSEIRKK